MGDRDVRGRYPEEAASGRLLAHPMPAEKIEQLLVGGAVTVERSPRGSNGNGDTKRARAGETRSPQIEALVD
jgi:hypothetical protein